METIKVSEIIFRDDLYPRFEHRQDLIQKYSESIEYLPPISINQNNILIDGFHRWKAHQLAKAESIKVEILKTDSEKQLKKLAYQLNSNHGWQLSNDEKKSYAIEYIGEDSIEDIAIALKVSREAVTKWTKNKRESLKEERDRLIVEEYLRAWNTQEIVAQQFETTQKNIAGIIKNIPYSKITEKYNFSPYLYNSWSLRKVKNKSSYFGAFPQVFMENLIYYHTEPFDIIYDPFAGGGTTVDICKKWYRRYYCADRIVVPGREKDIKGWNIQDGLPEDLHKPNMVFLDPPYRAQAENKYSEDSIDLGNMSLSDYIETLTSFIQLLVKKKIAKIAIVTAPCYRTREHNWEAYSYKFHEMLFVKYEIIAEYILPYSTEEYRGSQVNVAKELKSCMSITRNLVVWELK